MITQHTPGPWTCYADTPSVEPNWHIVTNESRMRVIANVHIEPSNVVDVANARLITAAPKLLDALILCRGNVSSLNDGHPRVFGEWLKAIDEAIAAATPEQL